MTHFKTILPTFLGSDKKSEGGVKPLGHTHSSLTSTSPPTPNPLPLVFSYSEMGMVCGYEETGVVDDSAPSMTITCTVHARTDKRREK